ncbi:MAG: ABC transporter permease [Candidatus Bipolaricaulia bacterium]
MNVLELQRVGVEFDGKTILEDISFTVSAGQFFILFGESGAGKTTLLRLVNRLDEATVGEIRYRGHSITDYDPKELRRRITMIFQEPRLFEGMVRENLLIAPRYHGLEVDLDRLLEAVGLEGFADRDVETLSGGQQQRVAIARALAITPEEGSEVSEVLEWFKAFQAFEPLKFIVVAVYLGLAIVVLQAAKLVPWKDALIPSSRAIVQLLIMGSILIAVFRIDRPGINALFLLVMVIMAAIIAGRHAEFKGRYAISLAVILATAALLIGPMTLLNVFNSQAAFLIPSLNGLKTTGVVWIPGLMTGMLLSGEDPIRAAEMQAIILYLIFIGTVLASIATTYIVRRLFFTGTEALRREVL